MVIITDDDTEVVPVTFRIFHVIEVQHLDIILRHWDVDDTIRIVAIVSRKTPPGR